MNENKKNAKEEFLRMRLEQLYKLPVEKLQEMNSLGKKAKTLANSEYWQIIDKYLRDAIKSYFDYKSNYSFAAKYINQAEGTLEEIKMVTAEAKAENMQELLDQIQFHIEDGRLAAIALTQVSTNIKK